MLLLGFAVLLWCLTFTLAYLAFVQLSTRQLLVAMTGSLLGILAFQTVLIGFRKIERSVQTQTALIGCGSLISIVFVLLVVVGNLVEPLRTSFHVVAELVTFWSVPVKGHIIARATDLHWYVGIAIAGMVFILQWVFTDALAAPA